MEETTNESSIGLDEWLYIQRELFKEKDFLVEILSKIDKQIHALQVEQLQLLNDANSQVDEPKNANQEVIEECDKDVDMEKPLNLEVASVLKHLNQEEEEDDQCGNDHNSSINRENCTVNQSVNDKENNHKLMELDHLWI